MSLADILRSGVALAHKITNDGELQETVSLRRWKGQDDYGKPTYAAALTLTAVVDHSTKKVKSRNGEDTVATTVVTFLQPIPALSPAVSGREEPIDERDSITLASGKSGPILRKDGGLADTATGRSFVVSVYLG